MLCGKVFLGVTSVNLWDATGGGTLMRLPAGDSRCSATMKYDVGVSRELIGAGGSNIQKIQDASGARINVDSKSEPSCLPSSKKLHIEIYLKMSRARHITQIFASHRFCSAAAKNCLRGCCRMVDHIQVYSLFRRNFLVTDASLDLGRCPPK